MCFGKILKQFQPLEWFKHEAGQGMWDFSLPQKSTWLAKPYSEPRSEVWLLLWHTAPFCGCIQVEKPCLSNAPDVLASQCLTFRACFSFIICPTYYVLAGQRQIPEVQIYVIYACTLRLFYQAKLKEHKLHKLHRKEQLYFTCLTPPAGMGMVPEGAPWCLSKREEKAITNTKIKLSSNSSLCCHCTNHKVPCLVLQLIYQLV